MPLRRLHACVLVAFASIVLATPAVSQNEPFADVTGVWAGEYPVAFARSHSKFPGQSVIVEMELDVYRQEGNLIWADNRWRLLDTDTWHTEETTGSFRLEQPDELYLTERAPLPIDWAQTGIFHGRLVDGTLYLTYQGIGGGTTFAVALERKAE